MSDESTEKNVIINQSGGVEIHGGTVIIYGDVVGRDKIIAGGAGDQRAGIPPPSIWYLAHPYPMPVDFTGRAAEKALLTQWLTADRAHPLLVLCALGGFGKSALAWHWLTNDVDKGQWRNAMWWSFYEGDASFDNFLRETLKSLRIEPPASQREQVNAVLTALQQSDTLLILDGFERQLRAFSGMNASYQGDEGHQADHDADCVNLAAEQLLHGVAAKSDLRGKVLMTTRLLPHALKTHGGFALQGCREEELTGLRPADAVAYFHAKGVRGTHTEIESACLPYGYHPLSLSLLAVLIAQDLRQPGDIAVAKRLDVSGDLVQRQHHVLQQSYDTLTPARQRLLSRIACFRSAVSYEALHALSVIPRSVPEAEESLRPADEIPRPYGTRNDTSESASTLQSSAVEQDASAFDDDLRDLLARGLLHHDKKTKRFDLHPIVRRYAYDRLTGNDRTTAHTQLRDYFAAVPTPDKVQTLDDLQPVIELYHHTVRAGQYDEACDLFYERINKATYYQFGAYQLRIELLRALFPDGEDRPPRLKNESDQAWTLNSLANSYSLSGQPRRAVPLYEQQNAIREKQGDKKNLAIGLGAVASVAYVPIGALRAADANHRRRIDLCREIADEFQEAVGHHELGWLLAYRSVWAEAEQELATALAMFEKRSNVQGQGINWAYSALRALLMARTSPPPPLLQGEGSALNAARRALELADETARTKYPHERDYVRAHWLLGAAYRLNGDLTQAEQHLSEALARCRNINNVEHEADILIDLARLRADQNEREEALRLAQEALFITERSEYVLQGADVHLFLAQEALKDKDRAQALQHAREARRLATCDGPPDYTYKVAHDEAGQLLGELGEK